MLDKVAYPGDRLPTGWEKMQEHPNYHCACTGFSGHVVPTAWPIFISEVMRDEAAFGVRFENSNADFEGWRVISIFRDFDNQMVKTNEERRNQE